MSNDILVKLYPKLEQLIAIYSIVGWKSPNQNSLTIHEDSEWGGTTFNLECEKFSSNLNGTYNNGTLFSCFSEKVKKYFPIEGEEILVNKVSSSEDYYYTFKWESLFGYELDVFLNPSPNRNLSIYSYRDRLVMDSNCLEELEGYSNKYDICGFLIYVTNVSGLHVSNDVTFLVSNGYLEWNADGSVNRIDEWVVYLDGSEYIKLSTLNKFIQLLLRQMQFAETDLEKAIPMVETKWFESDTTFVSSLFQKAEQRNEFSEILKLLK